MEKVKQLDTGHNEVNMLRRVDIVDCRASYYYAEDNQMVRLGIIGYLLLS